MVVEVSKLRHQGNHRDHRWRVKGGDGEVASRHQGVHMSSCKVRPRSQVYESSAAVEMCHWRRRITSECGRKKKYVPCVFVRGGGVPASSYTMKMSCTYMASCVAAGYEVSFGKLCHQRQRKKMCRVNRRRST